MTSSDAEQSGRERILARAVWPVSVLRSIAMSSNTNGQISAVASARPTRNAMTAREAQFTGQRMVEDDPAPNTAIVDGVSFPEHGPIHWAATRAEERLSRDVLFRRTTRLLRSLFTS